MSVPGNVGTSVRSDVVLRLCVVVSSAREIGHLGVGVSYARTISGFVRNGYVFVSVLSSHNFLSGMSVSRFGDESC